MPIRPETLLRSARHASIVRLDCRRSVTPSSKSLLGMLTVLLIPDARVQPDI